MLKLKDKSWPWKKKVVEAKRIFLSDDYMPRKEQALIDWLIFSLQNAEAKG